MVVMAFDLLHCNWMARRDASQEMVDWASAPQQPQVSTAKGIETYLSSAHLPSLTPCFPTDYYYYFIIIFFIILIINSYSRING